MSYIKNEKVLVEANKLTCSHPKVEKIWEYGAVSEMSTNSKMFVCLNLLLKDGTRHEFRDEEEWKAIEEAESFLIWLDAIT